jgi:diguanylate cyclase (GGDEF)-like protein
MAAIAMALAGSGYSAASAALAQHGITGEGPMIVLVTASAGAYFVITGALVGTVLHLKRGERITFATLVGRFGWVGTIYCANALLAALLHLAARQAGTIVLLTAAPVIALLLATVHLHLRQREAEAEQARARIAAAEREAATAAAHLRELRRVADHDGLTALPNRRRFMECLTEAVEAARADPTRRFAVMYLDFDRFKQINDTLGHAAGDAFLVHVAGRLQHQLRAGDVVGRLGGDEFAVLLNGIVGEPQVQALAERLLGALRLPYAVAGTEVRSSASIGIAFSRDDDLSADALLRDADAAMYRAKAGGKDRFVVHRG